MATAFVDSDKKRRYSQALLMPFSIESQGREFKSRYPDPLLFSNITSSQNQ
jgi:hypothetical protein